MIDIELLEQHLAELYPDTVENYQEKRDIFRTGVQWGYDHPYFNKGCPNREWHYLTEDPTDLPEVNKICLVKFSDGTGGISSMINKTKKVTSNVDDTQNNRSNSSSLDEYVTYKVWVTQYRDDIIAWSYYVMTKINGNYI